MALKLIFEHAPKDNSPSGYSQSLSYSCPLFPPTPYLTLIFEHDMKQNNRFRKITGKLKTPFLCSLSSNPHLFCLFSILMF